MWFETPKSTYHTLLYDTPLITKFSTCCIANSYSSPWLMVDA
jgi:hypothetical protein